MEEFAEKPEEKVEVEVEPIHEKPQTNEDAEEIIVEQPPRAHSEEAIKEEVDALKHLVNELDKEIKKENVEVINENDKPEEKEKFEKITNNTNIDPSLNIVPNEKKSTESIYTDTFNEEDDIKKIKIVPTKKNRVFFFEDADSD